MIKRRRCVSLSESLSRFSSTFVAALVFLVSFEVPATAALLFLESPPLTLGAGVLEALEAVSEASGFGASAKQ